MTALFCWNQIARRHKRTILAFPHCSAWCLAQINQFPLWLSALISDEVMMPPPAVCVWHSPATHHNVALAHTDMVFSILIAEQTPAAQIHRRIHSASSTTMIEVYISFIFMGDVYSGFKERVLVMGRQSSMSHWSFEKKNKQHSFLLSYPFGWFFRVVS